MKFVVLLISLGIGVLMLVKTEPLVNTTGRISWAERHLGGAGTYTLYKLIGVLIIILGMMYATGLVDRVFGGFFGFLGGGLSEQSS